MIVDLMKRKSGQLQTVTPDTLNAQDPFTIDPDFALYLDLAPYFFIASVALHIALKWWLRRQDRNSIYAGRDTLPKIGATFMMSLGINAGKARADEHVFRAPWGYRIGMLVVGAIALMYIGSGGGLMMVAVLALMAYGTVFAFLHDLRLTEKEVSVVDFFFRRKRAKLRDLAAVRHDTRNSFYVLDFEDGTRLKFLSLMSDGPKLMTFFEGVARDNRMREAGIAVAERDHPTSVEPRTAPGQSATPHRPAVSAVVSDGLASTKRPQVEASAVRRRGRVSVLG